MSDKCIAITKAGTRCSRKKKFGNYCGLHKSLFIQLEARNKLNECETEKRKKDNEISDLREGIKDAIKRSKRIMVKIKK